MTRSVWLAAVLVAPACGFTATTSGDSYPGGTPPAGDPTGTATRHCTADPALRLCIDFDDDAALTGDGSGLHHDAVSTDISVMPRDGEQAALLRATSRVTVAETLDLDITSNLTLSLWAHPDSRPPGGASYWALDNNRQYYVSYQPNGKFRCGLGNVTVDTALGVSAGDWYHVACTFDQSHGALMIYVGGVLAGCRAVTSAIPTDGPDGLAIGSNLGAGPTFTDPFIGGLDNIQVFARTLTPRQVCDVSGSDVCTDICPL